MFTSDLIVKDITNRLTHIAAYTKTLAKANLNDSAVLSENFYAGLLNIIYDDLYLKNSNLFDRNSEAIDLHDEEQRICVQVTIRQDREKYKETIEKFIKNELYKKYDKLYIFVLGYKDKITKDFDTQGLFSFDHKEDIVSLHELIPMINNMEEKQEEILSFIERKFKFPVFMLEDYTEQHFSQEIWGYVEALYQNSQKCVVPESLGRFAMKPQHYWNMACDALDKLEETLSGRKIYISKEVQSQVEEYILNSRICLDYLRIFSSNYDYKDQSPAKMEKWFNANQALEFKLKPVYVKTSGLLQRNNLKGQ
ncbi:SMEK domain-containing protein [Enterovibrio calviensis]|uniref:SMEK domain-containing protein n=1 Tax=Enterovibrio calviensis TaxID=91359 RepID=UPI003736103C